MKITSTSNEKVLAWAKLKMKKYRDIENSFLVEGDNLVREALKKGIVKEVIATYDTMFDVPSYVVNEKIMTKLSMMVNPPSIMAVCNYILPDNIEGRVLLLDKIQDPGNLGTIIRSAVAFNFKTIIISDDSVDLYNDKVIRASEGMIFHINLIKSDLESMINLLKNKGYHIIGTDVRSGKNIKEYKDEKDAFIIGNEGNGMSIEIKELCDAFVYLPMSKTVESLNAAVAASIIMYEAANE